MNNWCQLNIIITGFILNGNCMNSVSTALLTSHVIDFNSLSHILALVMKNLKRNICIRYNICKFFEEFKNRWRLLSTANII